MKKQQLFPSQSLDSRQLALLVGLCATALKEAFQTSTGEHPQGDGRTPDDAEAVAAQDRMGLADHLGILSTERVHHQALPINATEPKLLLTVEEAAQRLSVGRPKMWQLVMRREVLSIKIGASRRIPVAALEDYVARLCDGATEGTAAAGRSGAYGDTRVA